MLSVKCEIMSLLPCIVFVPMISSSVCVVGYTSLAFQSPDMYMGPLLFFLSTTFCIVSSVFLFSSYGLPDACMYVVMMVVGIVPVSEMYIILSVTGSMSSVYCS